jgi:hypothetical protein
MTVEIPPTGFELEDDKFDQYIEALSLKMNELGADTNDWNDVLAVMKAYWYIMTDEDGVQAYIDAVKQQHLLDEKAAAEATIAAIGAELSG